MDIYNNTALRQIIFVIVLLLAFSFSGGDKFNDVQISVIEQSQFPNCKIYEDSARHQFVELKLAVVPYGYVPEKGTVLEGAELIDVSGISKECLELIMAMRDYERAKTKWNQNR